MMKLFPTSTTHHLTRTGASIRMNSQPLAQLILPWIEPAEFPHIKEAMSKHGGTITIVAHTYHCSFPAGTIQEALPPRDGVPRHKILFPDGWWFLYEHASGSRLPQLIVDLPQGEQPDA